MDPGMLKDMMDEQAMCFKKMDKYSFQCLTEVTQKYIRKLPIVKDLIYPWKNFDWDYQTFVDNNYDPKKLGGSSKGDIKTIIKDIEILLKIVEGFLFSANPNSKSRSSQLNNNNSDLIKCGVTPSQINGLKELDRKRLELRDLINKTKNQTEKQSLQIHLADIIKKSSNLISACGIINKIAIEKNNQKRPNKDKFFDKSSFS